METKPCKWVDPNNVYRILNCPNEVNTDWFLNHIKHLLTHYDGSCLHEWTEQLSNAGVQGITTLTTFNENAIDPLDFGLDGPEPVQESKESERTDWIEDETIYSILAVPDSANLKNGFE